MSRTVDELQKHLQKEVFHYAQDGKKAAGRALGTLVEIITYYKLCAWGFSKNILIERRIPEFGRKDITHNVEFSLHKTQRESLLSIPRDGKAVRARHFAKHPDFLNAKLTRDLISSKKLLRNSAVLGERDGNIIVANLSDLRRDTLDVAIADLVATPIAIFECKRVGVEDGTKKGPQSIEKAKQGAYVARSVSALQKVITRDGSVLGFLPVDGGPPVVGDYEKMLTDIVTGKISAPAGFVLTVGITSNHGNWFTAEDHNKELKVLAAAYDWLLFLTDEGLMDFVENCILSPTTELAPVRTAFLESYNGEKGGSRFTKTCLDLEADQALRQYFAANNLHSSAWFNVITPAGRDLTVLSTQLNTLLT